METCRNGEKFLRAETTRYKNILNELIFKNSRKVNLKRDLQSTLRSLPQTERTDSHNLEALNELNEVIAKENNQTSELVYLRRKLKDSIRSLKGKILDKQTLYENLVKYRSSTIDLKSKSLSCLKELRLKNKNMIKKFGKFKDENYEKMKRKRKHKKNISLGIQQINKNIQKEEELYQERQEKLKQFKDNLKYVLSLHQENKTTQEKYKRKEKHLKDLAEKLKEITHKSSETDIFNYTNHLISTERYLTTQLSELNSHYKFLNENIRSLKIQCSSLSRNKLRRTNSDEILKMDSKLEDKCNAIERLLILIPHKVKELTAKCRNNGNHTNTHKDNNSRSRSVLYPKNIIRKYTLRRGLSNRSLSILKEEEDRNKSEIKNMLKQTDPILLIKTNKINPLNAPDNIEELYRQIQQRIKESVSLDILILKNTLVAIKENRTTQVFAVSTSLPKINQKTQRFVFERNELLIPTERNKKRFQLSTDIMQDIRNIRSSVSKLTRQLLN